MSRTKWQIRVAVFLVATLALLAVQPVERTAAADRILGSGSTFAEVALDDWAGDVNSDEGLGVEYTGQGSLGGLTQFQQGVVDFASSDVPYPETMVATNTRLSAYLPIVAGGTAILYNLRDKAKNRIENLRLSPRTIANIFFGNIKVWDHPDIVRENPDLENRLKSIESVEIKRAVRTPGSGTTGVFTDFLSTTAPDLWEDFVQKAQVVTQAGGNYTTDWPQSIQNVWNCECFHAPGSSEIATVMTQNTPGAQGTIGYAETAYAIQLDLPVVAVQNKAGFFRLPTARNVAVALLEATENGDGTQNLEGVFVSNRDEAYPASSYNYLVIPTEGLPAGKGETLGRFMIYSVTEGQAEAADLGYSPMPPNLVQFALNRVPLINGAPAPPPLGDWGRYYEDLGVDEPVVVVDTTLPPTVTTAPPTGTPTTTTAPTGDTTATTTATDDGTDADDGGGDAGDDTGSDDPTQPGSSPSGGTPTTRPGSSPGAAQPGGATPSGVDPVTGEEFVTVTSIAEDGTVTEIRIPAASGSLADPAAGDSAFANASGVGLSSGLEFDDEGNVVSRDGRKVPKVDVIGVAPLLGIAGVVVALLLLPPVLVGGAIQHRRNVRRGVTPL